MECQFTRSEFKEAAIQMLGGGMFAGKWMKLAMLMLGFALVVALACLLGAITYGVGELLVLLFVLIPFVLGIQMVVLGFVRTGDIRYRDCGAAFSARYYYRSMWITIVPQFYVFLWSLLFIVPGIVKTMSYTFASYVQIDHPDWKADECITESRRLMNGYKWWTFKLWFSLLGWSLLVGITGGLAGIWVCPYITCIFCQFYEKIRGGNGCGSPQIEAR